MRLYLHPVLRMLINSSNSNGDRDWYRWSMQAAGRKVGILCVLMSTTGTIGYAQKVPPPSFVLNFDETFVDNIVGNPLGVFGADYYAKVGVRIRTVESEGRAEIGREMRLMLIFNGFELLGGPDQPSISPPNFLIAFGGQTRDVLLQFAKPVQSVSVTTDRCFPEDPDVVRLIALEPTNDPSRFRVLAVDAKSDDAMRAPANELRVTSSYQSFRYVLFQCTTEQEGFDDLKFVPSQSDAPDASQEEQTGPRIKSKSARSKPTRRPIK